MWWVILWVWCEAHGVQREKMAWIEEPPIPLPGEPEWNGGQQDGIGWNPKEARASPLDDMWMTEEETQ